MLKQDADSYPITKQVLAAWQFVQRDLEPLLIFHYRDKKLSFLTLMALVKLTELPDKSCDAAMHVELFRDLALIKESFLEPKVMETLILHLSDCL